MHGFDVPFIAIEGIDGSGTSTQTHLLTNGLRNKGYKVFITQAPSASLWGGRIRLVLNKQTLVDPLGLAFAFMADRVSHLSRVQSELQARSDDLLVSGRLHLSFLAYQHRHTRKKMEWLSNLLKWLPFPDVTFFIDADPDECYARIKKRSGQDIFESAYSLRAMRDGFFEAISFMTSKGQKIITVPGKDHVLEISALILSHAQDELGRIGRKAQ